MTLFGYRLVRDEEWLSNKWDAYNWRRFIDTRNWYDEYEDVRYLLDRMVYRRGDISGGFLRVEFEQKREHLK